MTFAALPGQTLLSWTEMFDHLAKLGIAYLLAFPIGWFQEREERSAGVRTFPLVALASCGLVVVGLKVLDGNAGAEARVLEGLIAGIGFIGGGAILKGERAVQGTASAASIWNVGIIGAATAYGLYDIGLMLSAANLATLRFLLPLKREDHGNNRNDRPQS
ncbi:MAG: MgtC/SapB family protein [Proteobacteria bacterium]|nr:MgtC/SapB family protein [Pseudomonadota bacterium]